MKIDHSVRIYLSEDETQLAFTGEYMASQIDYEIELTEYEAERCPSSILQILQPGQEIVLEEGKYWLAEDLSLLVDD